MVKTNCPNCGSSLQVGEDRQFVFCQYCGTKIVDLNNTVIIDRSAEIDSLLVRAVEYEIKGDYSKAKEYCEKVLDIDPHNDKARIIEDRLPKQVKKNNVIIKYDTKSNDRLKVKIDDNNWLMVEPNGEVSLTLSTGFHRILFSGRKTYDKSIKVDSLNRQIIILYKESILKNEITMSVR